MRLKLLVACTLLVATAPSPELQLLAAGEFGAVTYMSKATLGPQAATLGAGLPALVAAWTFERGDPLAIIVAATAVWSAATTTFVISIVVARIKLRNQT